MRKRHEEPNPFGSRRVYADAPEPEPEPKDPEPTIPPGGEGGGSDDGG